MEICLCVRAPHAKITSYVNRLLISITICFCLNACTPLGNQIHKSNDAKNPFKCEVCFTPGAHCLPFILQPLEKAKKHVGVMAYSFTSQPIADALIKAKKRGVNVILIVDKSQLYQRYSKITQLLKEGVSIYIDHRPKIQHNKIIIIDDKVVIGGSYNWSDSAEKRNAENLTIIRNCGVVKQYQDNFDKRKSESFLLSDLKNGIKCLKNNKYNNKSLLKRQKNNTPISN